MRQTTEIRRRHDGSIDTGYYAGIGRALHGKAVGDLIRSILRLSVAVVLISVLIGVAVRVGA